MNAACRAKSAYARATIAIRMLKTQKRLGRPFDACGEMGDGDDMVREIRRRSRHDPELVQALIRHGYDYWLKPGYMGEPYPPIQETFL